MDSLIVIVVVVIVQLTRLGQELLTCLRVGAKANFDSSDRGQGNGSDDCGESHCIDPNECESEWMKIRRCLAGIV